METLLQILSSLGIDKSLYYQLGIFAVSYVILSKLLFRPYYAAFKERQSRTVGSDEHAERLVAETAELETIYQKKARALNTEHKAIYDQSRSEALHQNDEMTAKARANAKAILDNTRAQIDKELVGARKLLSEEAPVVSKSIVNQLAGKELIQ